MYPRFGFWYRLILGVCGSVLCTLVPVFGVQRTSAKTTLLETTLLQTPDP